MRYGTCMRRPTLALAESVVSRLVGRDLDTPAFTVYSIGKATTFNLHLTRAAEGSETPAVDFQP